MLSFFWLEYNAVCSIPYAKKNKTLKKKYESHFLQRSSRYDDLMIAEEKAKKSSNGLHNKKPSTARRIADISGEKSKQFLPFLQRAGRMQAVVEFVASASRYRLYIPRETCVITFLLSGIQVRPSSLSYLVLES